MTSLPFVARIGHLTVTVPFCKSDAVGTGISGTVNGCAVDVVPTPLIPAIFVAVTLNVYVLPPVNRPRALVVPVENVYSVTGSLVPTALITNGKYAYDIEITAPGTGVVTRLVQGTVQVSPQVTRTS